MKKITAVIAAVSAAALLFAGCGAQGKQTAMYSNLKDSAAQHEVTEALKAHGVTDQQTDTLIAWVNDFNDRISSGTLPEGFQKMPETGADYAGLIVDYKEAEDGTIVPEANCRLTSYLLMKNMIETNGTHDDNDTYLFFDTEAIDTCPTFAMRAEERANFVSLFNWVPLNGASTLEEHTALIRKAWEDRGIQIGGDGISLITVYLHGTFDDVRFVGHTGVLAETEDGLLFVEKFGPQLPFQATKFHSREELKSYLLGRTDLYGDETELAPIIMENDQVL